MKAATRANFRRVLAEAEQLKRTVDSQKKQQGERVRQAAGNRQGALLSNLLLDLARAGLEAFQVLMFKGPVNPHPGPSGELATNGNLDWLSERFDGVGPTLGVPCETVAAALLAAAERQLKDVHNLLRDAQAAAER